MLTEEEKKAIEVLKSKRASEQLMISGKMCVDILLNLIEKQQKEIEHWKAGMKIVERDKNNHIERLEKELNSLKEKNKEAIDYMYDLLNTDIPNVGTADINNLLSILEEK